MTKRDYIHRKAAVMSQTLDELLPTYDQDDDNPIYGCLPLPSESEVVLVLQLLDSVFFPGYREECPALANSGQGYPIDTLVTERLDEVYDRLFRQVTRAIPFRWASEYARARGVAIPDMDIEQEAERVAGWFFSRLPAIRELLKKDVKAAYRGDPAAHSYAEIILGYPGLRAIVTHRVAHELYTLDVPIIPRIMNEWVHRLTGIDIHPGARIGESFFIDHGTGVVVGETTVIGDRVKIYQGVTLGARSFPLDDQGNPVKGIKRHPTIEDDVIIYPGVTILGGKTVIGRGSVIGNNVRLTRSVAPESKVTLQMLDAAETPSIA
jgi:serine O-acetyltransferase